MSTQFRAKRGRSLPAERGAAAVKGRVPDRPMPAAHRRTRRGRLCTMMDERWGSLLACTSDLVVIVDRAGLIVHVNHTSGSLARSQDGVIGRCICDFLAPEYRMSVRESIERVFRTGETIEQAVCFSSNGTDGLYSEARIGAIGQHGRTVAVGIFFADVTEREKLQVRLKEKEMLLKSIVRAVPKMMEIMEGLIHHATGVGESRRRAREFELCRRQMVQIGRLASIGKASSSLTQRLPQFLTAINMSIENALARLDTVSCQNDVREELEVALRSVCDLATGVEEVRRFAETESRKSLIHAIDLRAVLVRVIQLVEARARGANTVIRIDDRNGWSRVRMAEGDAEQLVFSLFERLLSVADSKRHHRITVSSTVSDGHLELQLAGDEAIGNEEAWGASLSPLVADDPGGMAMDLGLYVASDIVGRYEGTIRYERVEGAGCAFLISLPVAN